MDFIPLIQSLGAPIALSAYLLWQQSRFLDAARKEHAEAMARYQEKADADAKRIAKAQEDAIAREREYAEAFHRAARNFGAVVERNNTIISALCRHMESEAAHADTRTLHAVKTPPPKDTPFPFPRAENHHG